MSPFTQKLHHVVLYIIKMAFFVTMVQKTKAQNHGLQTIYMEDCETRLAVPQPTIRKQEQNKA